MGTRVLLVDDHDVVRAGLRSALEALPDMEVVGEAGDGRTALALVRHLSPQVVLMDISMPELNGLDTTRQVIAEGCGTKVITVSMHADRQWVSEVLRAGASGYVLKNTAVEELRAAIRAVMAGKVYLSPAIAGVVVQDYVRHVPDRARGPFDTLTPREREVLQLLAEGKTSKEMAAALNVSAKTVEMHRGQIMTKLGIHTVAELTKLAIREGLTALE
jgi:DNA-binding NarL/FixJ family response regulator